ncbi:hypothetical protein GCM10028822_15030 [Hymenobacter terrigena]
MAALTLALLPAGVTHAQTPASFATVTTYFAGSGGPSAVAIADVNGDGRPDIISGNSNAGAAVVLLAQAGGGFGAASAYPAGASSGLTGVAVADVNGDGRMDIVTANGSNSIVGVLLGQAGGGFGTVTTYSTGAFSYPTGVVVTDVNGDGRKDIITANGAGGAAGVLLGQVGGGFATVNTYPTDTGSYPYGVAVGDMNGDGRPDIVTANGTSNSASVLLGQASGGFAPANSYSTGAGSYPQGVAVADMNGDGRLDIVTANNGSQTVGVLLGQAGGGYATANTYSSGTGSQPQGVAVADVNGDGRKDIITANNGNFTAGVLLGQAGGGFGSVSSYSGGLGTMAVAAADMNGDGRPDLVTANYNSNTVGVLLNTGTFAPLAAATGTAAAEVSLFPNPARGSFAVQLPAAWGAAPVQATLLNALGQAVRQQTAALPAGAPLAFATAGLAPGVYQLRIQAGNRTIIKRAVLE